MGKTYKYINVAQLIEAFGSLALGLAWLGWFVKTTKEENMTDDEKEAKKKESLAYNFKKALITKLGGEVSS